jgi:small neutral amino acid transporter SnatA (MarC family)
MYVMIECGHKRLRLFKLLLDIRTVAVIGGLILLYIGYRYLMTFNW